MSKEKAQLLTSRVQSDGQWLEGVFWICLKEGRRIGTMGVRAIEGCIKSINYLRIEVSHDPTLFPIED